MVTWAQRQQPHGQVQCQVHSHAQEMQDPWFLSVLSLAPISSSNACIVFKK